MFGHAHVVAPAKVLADEGYGLAENSGSVALQHQKYIVEVHPEGEAPFRSEVTAWVSWMNRPEVGDVLNVNYRPGSTSHVELIIEGDPRYDWRLIAAKQQDDAEAKRKALLDGPPSDTL